MVLASSARPACRQRSSGSAGGAERVPEESVRAAGSGSCTAEGVGGCGCVCVCVCVCVVAGGAGTAEVSVLPDVMAEFLRGQSDAGVGGRGDGWGERGMCGTA